MKRTILDEIIPALIVLCLLGFLAGCEAIDAPNWLRNIAAPDLNHRQG